LEIKPFKPYMFSSTSDAVTSPPFDSITREQEAKLKSFPYNITHLTLPRGTSGILESSIKLANWIRDGELVRSVDDIIIIVVQEFRIGGEKLQRSGIITLAKVFPEDGSISPHEKTFPGPVRERANLMGEIGAQLEPLFLTVPSPNFEKVLKRMVSSAKHLMTFDEPAGVTNSIFCISDPVSIARIRETLLPEKAIVADGHHRLRASIYLAENSTGKEKEFWSYTMSYITSVYERGLLISGVHRIVSTSINANKIIENLRNFFTISEHSSLDRINHITIYNGKFIELVPDDRALETIRNIDPASYISTSVIVNEFIFKRLGHMNEKDIEDEVRYTHDVSIAIRHVDEKRSAFAVLMPEWDKEEFIRLASENKILPQKSTYFYPKIPSGIAINKLDS